MEKTASYFPDLEVKTASDIDLKYWAVKCATDYLNSGTPLNSSIKNIAENNDLNHEHVKRISEMANTEVFQRKFDMDEDKNVYFDVADPAKINQDSPLNKKTELGDYSSPPSYDTGQNEKVASIEFDYGDMHQDPMLDLLELKTDLTRIHQDLDDSFQMDTLREKLARDYLYKLASEELETGSFSKMAQAIHSIEPTVLDDLTQDLIRNEKIARESLGPVKLAHNLNESHQLLKAAQEYRQLKTKVANVKEALKEVDSHLNKLSHKIKELKEIK